MSHAADVVVRARASRSGAWILSGLLVLLGWGALPQGAAAAPLMRAQTHTEVSEKRLQPRAERHFILDSLLGNRTRMIQIATLALLLGLFILIRK